MLPAMSLDGILYVDIVEGSYNTASFTALIFSPFSHKMCDITALSVHTTSVISPQVHDGLTWADILLGPLVADGLWYIRSTQSVSADIT